MSISYWLDDSDSSTIETDVLIVGGGIAGVSAAYWCNKEDPNMKVTIVDKGRLGAGATGRNAGFITCGSVEHFNRLVERWGQDRAMDIWRFSEINLELLKDEIIQGDTNLEFRDDGTFSLASTEQELHELGETADLMAKNDISVEKLSQSDIESRLGVVNFVGGIKYLKDASVNPIKLIEKIKAQTTADFIPNVEVFDFDTQSDGTVLVKTDKQQIRASVVIMATNGYSASLHKYFSDKIYPTRGQILSTEPVEQFMEGACYANFVLDYFRQLEDGRVLIGGFRQIEKESEVGYSDHITDPIQNALYEFLQTYIPRLENKKITHRWSGIMGFAADGQPLVGALQDQPQVFFTGGFTAHGLGLAFHAGKCVTNLMFGRDIPEFINAKRF